MPTVQVNDIEMYYELKGTGEPLVMIMGFTANADWWPSEFVESLSQNYQLLLFDNRGAGRSKQGKGRYSIPQMAKDTADLMTILNIPQANIFGVSMGGMIAQEIALLYPKRVKKLILACTTCSYRYGTIFFIKRLKLWFLYLTSSKVRKRSLLDNFLFSQEYLNKGGDGVQRIAKIKAELPMSPLSLIKQYLAITQVETYSRLSDIQPTTLVITGDKDYLMPPQNSKILANHIPKSKLVLLEGAGHAFITEDTEKTLVHVERFLETKEIRPKAV